MYNNQNHRQNHGLLNGGATHHNFQPQVNLNKAFQSQTHGHQGHHLNNHDHSGLGSHGANFGNHQHTISASTLSNNTPHFTPAHLQNGTPETTNSLGKPPNEHYAEQLREYQKLRMAEHKPHFYARTTSSVSRQVANSQSSNNQQNSGDENGDRRRIADPEEDMGTWNAMDLCGQGLRGMAPALFRHYPKLRKIYLNWNKLPTIPPQIGQMRYLTVLDLSMNQLDYLPPEIGMLTNLKRLLLFDNRLEDLPFEMGSLFQLEMLGLEGNPMRQDYKDRLVEHGPQELIRYLREQAPRSTPPMDREWIPLTEERTGATPADTFTVLSWNILCDRAATAAMYGYTPSEALAWQHRRDMIFEEMTGRNADIMCLQEMDIENFNEFFRPNLASAGYKGIFFPKSRAQTMGEKESRNVDGCAIFFKNTKYIQLDKKQIVYSREAIQRPDMKGEHDVYNRVMPRDHIAVVAFLENRQTGSRLIVANTHLTWEPWHSDIKIVQVAILMEALVKIGDEWAQLPPCKDKELFKYANEDSAEDVEEIKPDHAPSMKYDDSRDIPLVVCGDFNSTRDSGVHELITQGSLSNSHVELGNQKYGDFTRHGMNHPFSLKSAYSHINELPFTNYTPDFRKVIDWVFYSTNSVQVNGLLGEVDPEYMRRVPGWPNHYFPSDHLPLMMEFGIKERKDRKAVTAEADFGSRRESRN
ncbi:hypothetical protein M409DRAFT_64705 [Zasmidium cellare ATCC 36951]|uniref:CCR4-Not complex 3'-5'-exoribonuclease subunit Ccr4 n=1 Tax=Zasmidium cellare ATCC 36951 TaxID=1080233 RepID=A0A6A6CR52_ZASCE|nr:uncharacterized protein M409DRAFT_64705 [Zasmidium cellare ATCC 36951]KAF2169644.1 hypothetical protein M409DRAFT_64705 [Zasmidium cellare ATCC 36951]